MNRSNLRRKADIKNRKNLRRRVISRYKSIVQTTKDCAKDGNYGFSIFVRTQSEVETVAIRLFRYKHRDITVSCDYDCNYDNSCNSQERVWIRWN